jgi:2Fe-2S ferredoxin
LRPGDAVLEVIVESAEGVELARFAAEPGRLLDAADEADAPIRFSCRSADCGSCLVEIAGDADAVEPPEGPERDWLSAHAASPGARLACQLRVRGAGTVRLRVVA